MQIITHSLFQYVLIYNFNYKIYENRKMNCVINSRNVVSSGFFMVMYQIKTEKLLNIKKKYFSRYNDNSNYIF